MKFVGCSNLTVSNAAPPWSMPVCSAVDDTTHGPATFDGKPASSFAPGLVTYASINQGVAALGGSPGSEPIALPPLRSPSYATQAANALPAPILPGLLDGVTDGIGDSAEWGYAPLSAPVANAGVPLYAANLTVSNALPRGRSFDPMTKESEIRTTPFRT